MALLSLTCLASLISSFLIMIPSATASVRIQAAAPPPTPAASLILNGFSPRPTNPPGSNGVPRELLRRVAGIQFPPPDNWCGFIEGDYNNPLACTNTRYTCIFTGPVAVGCCVSLNGPCSALNTACMDNTANWAPYRSDSSRLICSTPSSPYCASLVFPQGHKYFFCESTANAITSIGFLNDFYYTAIGSTVGPSSADPSTTPTRSSSTASTADATSADSKNPSSTTILVRITTTTTPAKKSIGPGAIAGIGVGVGLLLLAAIAGIIFCACKRKRKQNPVTSAQQAQANFNNNTPMQQQGNMAPPYQNPSQPNAQYSNSPMPFFNDSKSPYDSTRASAYGQPSPMAAPILDHGDPNNRASTSSPPFSHNPSLVGNMRPLSPNLPMTGGADVQRINSPDYYRHPTGPVSEIGGTGQIYEASGLPVHAGGGAQDHGQGQQYPPGALNTQFYAAQAQAVPPQQIHEAPAQQEPKYVPYNPGVATAPPQQYSSQQEYPTNNHPPAQGAPAGRRRPVPPSAGPWEIGS